MPTMVKVKCAVCDKEFEVELKRYNEKNKSTGIFIVLKNVAHIGVVNYVDVQLAAKKFGKQILKYLGLKQAMFIVVEVALTQKIILCLKVEKTM